VLLVPPTADTRGFAAGRIVAAYDFSAPAASALATAIELAGSLGLALDLLHVVEVTYVSSPYGPVTAPVDYEALRRRAARLLTAVASTGTVRPRPATRVGSAVEETLEHARAVGASLIVVGSHGRRGVRRLVLGSVAEGIARRAPCPVLVVPVAASRDAAEQDADVELVAA
jgi:nucleotide-binding universal stress UspA family protein